MTTNRPLLHGYTHMKLYKHNIYPCHWLNGTPAADWIDAISTAGIGVAITTKDYPAEPISGAAARKLFEALVMAGYITEMSAEEAREYSTLYRDSDKPEEEPRTYGQLLAERLMDFSSWGDGSRVEKSIKEIVDYEIRVGDYVKVE